MVKPVVTRTRTRMVSIVDVDYTKPLMAALPKLLHESSERAAQEAKEAMQDNFESNAQGNWPENAPSTLFWKRHGPRPAKIMSGRTGKLYDGIRIVDAKIFPDTKIKGHMVGWLDEPHPDTGGGSRRVQNMAQLALMHEFGSFTRDEFGRFTGVNSVRPPRPGIISTWQFHGDKIARNWTLDFMARIDLFTAASAAQLGGAR